MFPKPFGVSETSVSNTNVSQKMGVLKLYPNQGFRNSKVNETEICINTNLSFNMTYMKPLFRKLGCQTRAAECFKGPASGDQPAATLLMDIIRVSEDE